MAKLNWNGSFIGRWTKNGISELMQLDKRAIFYAIIVFFIPIGFKYLMDEWGLIEVSAGWTLLFAFGLAFLTLFLLSPTARFITGSLFAIVVIIGFIIVCVTGHIKEREYEERMKVKQEAIDDFNEMQHRILTQGAKENLSDEEWYQKYAEQMEKSIKAGGDFINNAEGDFFILFSRMEKYKETSEWDEKTLKLISDYSLKVTKNLYANVKESNKIGLDDLNTCARAVRFIDAYLKTTKSKKFSNSTKELFYDIAMRLRYTHISGAEIIWTIFDKLGDYKATLTYFSIKNKTDKKAIVNIPFVDLTKFNKYSKNNESFLMEDINDYIKEKITKEEFISFFTKNELKLFNVINE